MLSIVNFFERFTAATESDQRMTVTGPDLVNWSGNRHFFVGSQI